MKTPPFDLQPQEVLQSDFVVIHKKSLWSLLFVSFRRLFVTNQRLVLVKHAGALHRTGIFPPIYLVYLLFRKKNRPQDMLFSFSLQEIAGFEQVQVEWHKQGLRIQKKDGREELFVLTKKYQKIREELLRAGLHEITE